MSARITSNIMTNHNKIPFSPLVNDQEYPAEGETARNREVPKFKNIMGKFVGNLSLKKQRRYIDCPQYKHTRLKSTQEDSVCENFNVMDDEEFEANIHERSTSMEEIGELSRDFSDFLPPPGALRGRRRSRSDSDLLATEHFARRTRRAAICEEMERDIFMENGITLRKCRKNLVLNQILENLSLL